jgi:hypothetical protein
MKLRPQVRGAAPRGALDAPKLGSWAWSISVEWADRLLPVEWCKESVEGVDPAGPSEGVQRAMRYSRPSGTQQRSLAPSNAVAVRYSRPSGTRSVSPAVRYSRPSGTRSVSYSRPSGTQQRSLAPAGPLRYAVVDPAGPSGPCTSLDPAGSSSAMHVRPCTCGSPTQVPM